MSDSITVTGVVASEVRHLVTSEGLPISSFRLASRQRRYDRRAGSWVDGETNWYSVSAFRQLAANVAGSVSRGERVIVTGRLRMREWVNGERKGTSVDIEADALGHDLTWGTSSFARVIGSAGASGNSAGGTGWADADADAENADPETADGPASQAAVLAADSAGTPF